MDGTNPALSAQERLRALISQVESPLPSLGLRCLGIVEQSDEVRTIAWLPTPIDNQFLVEINGNAWIVTLEQQGGGWTQRAFKTRRAMTIDNAMALASNYVNSLRTGDYPTAADVLGIGQVDETITRPDLAKIDLRDGETVEDGLARYCSARCATLASVDLATAESDGFAVTVTLTDASQTMVHITFATETAAEMRGLPFDS